MGNNNTSTASATAVEDSSNQKQKQKQHGDVDGEGGQGRDDNLLGDRKTEVRNIFAVDALRGDKYMNTQAPELIKEISTFCDKWAEISHSKMAMEQIVRNPKTLKNGVINDYKDAIDAMMSESRNIDKGSSGSNLLHLLPTKQVDKLMKLVENECARIRNAHQFDFDADEFNLICEIHKHIREYSRNLDYARMLELTNRRCTLRVLLLNAMDIQNLNESYKAHFLLLAHAIV
jgi:hypothetical protein